MEMVDQTQRVGLILSGGGARAFAHIGVMRVLERSGIDVDVIAGSSMGAILGAFCAAGYRAEDIYQLAKKTSWRDVFDLSLNAGLIKGEKLHNFLAEYLPRNFDDLKKPLAVSTTDIETGEEVFILKGDLITALRASSCYPGAFEPVQFQGRTLADGGIVNNLPVNAVAFLNANFTVASDVTPPRRATFKNGNNGDNWWERMLKTVRLERRNPMAQMVLRSSDIMQSILTDIQYSMHPADIRIQPAMPHIHIESFFAYEEIVELGERAASETFQMTNLLPEARARKQLTDSSTQKTSDSVKH